MKDWMDNLKSIDIGSLKSLHDESAVKAAERVMDAQIGLSADLKYASRATRRYVKDLREISKAEQHIERIPDKGESFHCVISGRYSLWNVVPAIHALAQPHRIETLTVCTLGFSKMNIDALAQMLDRQQIGTATLLCSHYFAATSKPIYEHAAGMMKERKQRFLSMRTHCKLLLIALADGRKIVVESSANLRSSKNLEQMTIIHDAGLYSFHLEWLNSLFANNQQHPKPAAP